MGRHQAVTRLILAMTLLLSAGCALQVPARVDAPASGPAEIGVAYGVEVYCSIPFKLGGLWWNFEQPMSDWPAAITSPFPFNIWDDIGVPWEVPGIVTLTSPTEAIFRADVDGTEFRLTGHEENPTPGDACL
jgi:hypothetical protein